jgi:predicted alpha/beta-hydrolase family hydrolase
VHPLVTIKQEHNNVLTAYPKSHNAGCYHNALLIRSLKSIGERAGIRVRRYDFSDPQSRKDICDHKRAPMKGHIQRCVDEKQDVVTAGGMKEALDSYGAVRGYRVAVSEVDMSKAAEMVEWKGIFYIKFARAVYA